MTEYEQRPPYEICHSTAKLFLELNDPKSAAEIWECLLEEDDNIAEVHYYLGLAYRHVSSSASLECLQRSKEVKRDLVAKFDLKKQTIFIEIQLLIQTGGFPALISQVDEIVAEVSKENIELEEDENNNNNGDQGMEI